MEIELINDSLIVKITWKIVNASIIWIKWHNSSPRISKSHWTGKIESNPNQCVNKYEEDL